jgi:hypothetical protein
MLEYDAKSSDADAGTNNRLIEKDAASPDDDSGNYSLDLWDWRKYAKAKAKKLIEEKAAKLKK